MNESRVVSAKGNCGCAARHGETDRQNGTERNGTGRDGTGRDATEQNTAPLKIDFQFPSVAARALYISWAKRKHLPRTEQRAEKGLFFDVSMSSDRIGSASDDIRREAAPERDGIETEANR